MKPILFLIVGAALVINSVWMAVDTSGVVAGSTGLLVERAYLDLGDVQQGDEIPFNFKVSNTTSSNIGQITLQSSCGCTIAEMPKSELKQGESTEIVGKFLSLRKRGEPTVNLLLEYESLGRKQHELLTLHARVNGVLDITPELVRLSPQDEQDGHLTQVIEIAATKGVKFRILQIVTTHPAITAHESSVTSGLGNSRKVQVSLDRNSWSSGDHERTSHAFVILTTDVETEPPLRVRIAID